MSATAFAGFAAGTKSVPVPAPLLGSLLAEIDDVAELKCTLRFLWHAAQVSGAPKRVPASRLETDSVLLAALGSQEEIARGLGLAVSRGTLIEVSGWCLLRTPQNEHAAESLGWAPQAAGEARREKPNVFDLYEQNIGMLTPLIADELKAAEEDFPASWIESAIREAAASNARSWRYVAATLERWKRGSTGAKQRGEPGRHPETLTAAEYLERQRRS